MSVLYGAFDLDNHSTPPVGYYVIGRQLGTTQVTLATTPVARYEGVKVSGQYVGQRPIKLQVKVVGASRNDLEAKLDALYLALQTPLQKLKLHSADTRYFVAIPVYAPADLGLGEILAKTVPIDFICPEPYAITDGTATHDTGNQVLSLSGGVYPYSFSVTGNGTVFNRPVVQVFNRRSITSTQLTSALVSGNAYTSLSVNALNAALYAGDTIILTDRHTPPVASPPTQTLVVSSPASIGDTTINVNSFTANFSYPINSGGLNPEYTTVVLDIHWDSVTLQQTTDNQYWEVGSSLNPGVILVPATDEYVLFTSDPNVGMSVVDSANPSTFLNFAGTPITLNPISTPYILAISSVSVPIVEILFSWSSRWLN